jgi:hypothetical protein
MAKRPPPPAPIHPTTDWPRPPAIPIVEGVEFADIALAQAVMDLCHKRNIEPKHAAAACAMAAATFCYQHTDFSPAGRKKAAELGVLMRAMWQVQHVWNPKEPGALAPETVQ